MNILESYDKNKEKHIINNENKHLLNEVTTVTGGGGGVDTFVGGAGDTIDTKFAGPFHPIFGDLEKSQLITKYFFKFWL